MKIRSLALIIAIVILSNGYVYSQIGNKIITGVSKKGLDTLAFENTQKLVEESAGLVEKEIIPSQYIVGPNDKFKISILTADPIEFRAIISPEGKLMLKGAGTVSLKNKTLEESYGLIKSQLQKYYNTENIHIVLHDIREFKVVVTGAVRKSVTVAATPMDRVSEVIDKAGGTTPESSVRNISLRRKDSTIKCDLLKFFLTGDTLANPFVRGGDVVIVSNVDEYSTIGAFGEFISEGVFEYSEGDSLSTLVKFVQGFTKSADLDKVEFARFDEAGNKLERRILDLSSWKNIKNTEKRLKGDFPLKDGDRLYARKRVNWDRQEYAIIEGEVKFPGKYPIIDGTDQLSDLLSWCKGFTDDASIQNTEFIRQKDLKKKDPEMERLSKLPPSEMSKSEFKYYQARVREKKGVLSVNFDKLISNNDPNNDVYLRHKDSIIVPKKSFFINIQGRVNNPGKIKYKEGLTYLEYIELAGGFGYRAAPDETLVTNNQGEIFLAESMDYNISPGDVILVPPEDETTFMEVFTEVLTITTQLATVMGVVLTIINLSR